MKTMLKSMFVLALGMTVLMACNNDKATDSSAEAAETPTVEPATSDQSEAMATTVAEEVAATPAATTPVATEATKAVDPKSADPKGAPSKVVKVEQPVLATTSIKFDNIKYDWGTVKQGDAVNHTYKFTNTGKTPLVITNAKASCGCTVPNWTKDPVAPGKTGEIKVKFDSAGKSGQVTKTITVTANTEPENTVLSILGKIDAPANGKSNE
jgi:hypothetical protein